MSLFSRCKTVLLTDRSRALPERVLAVLRHDLLAVLGEYFETETLDASLDCDETGALRLRIDATVARVKDFCAAGCPPAAK